MERKIRAKRRKAAWIEGKKSNESVNRFPCNYDGSCFMSSTIQYGFQMNWLPFKDIITKLRFLFVIRIY